MPRVLVLGTGRQAFGAAFDLVRFVGDLELTLVDSDLSRANRLRDFLGHSGTRVLPLDIRNEADMDAASRSHDAVLSCLPYPINPVAIESCLRTKTPYVDLGTEPEDIERLREIAGEIDFPIVYDAGLAPGLINQLASWLLGRQPGADEARLYCGGLPGEPVGPLKYYPYFSLTGLVGEYADPALAIVDGKMATLPSLTGLEMLDLPEVGMLEAFVTSGGSSDAPIRLAGKLRNYQYKTLRYPGHLQGMELLRDLGMWSEDRLETRSGTVAPIDVFEALLIQAGSADGAMPPDRVVLHVEVGQESATVDHRYDVVHGLSAMEQLTGFSGAIVLQAVLAGEAKSGIRSADDSVPGAWMVDKLGRRGVKVHHAIRR